MASAPAPPGWALDVAADAVRPGPLLAVDLHDTAAVERCRAALPRAADLGRILVGVARGAPPPPTLLDDLTLTLCDLPVADQRVVCVPEVDSAVAGLAAAVARHPDAAAVLAAHLRHSGGLPVAAALVAESTAYSMVQAGPEHAAWRRAYPPRPRSGEPPPLRLHRVGDSLHVTLDRASRHNAIDRAMRDLLLDALAIAAADPAVRVELRGAGPTFCSGGDLDEFGTAADVVSAHLLRTTRSVGLAIHDVADRTTAVVHGACAGAGVELPAFAGRVVAAAGTTFRLPELDMGLIPGAGGTVSLPRRIGRWRTAWLAMSGVALDAATARDWGLVDAVA